MQLSDTCPYWNGHKTRHLPFQHAALFRFYCSNLKSPLVRAPRTLGTIKRGGSTYRHGKLYKLYWRLHP